MSRSERLCECADCGVVFPNMFYTPLESCAQVVRQALAGGLTVSPEHRRMVIDLVDVLCLELSKSRVKLDDLKQLLRISNSHIV
jgi:hypothetical protein